MTNKEILEFLTWVISICPRQELEELQDKYLSQREAVSENSLFLLISANKQFTNEFAKVVKRNNELWINSATYLKQPNPKQLKDFAPLFSNLNRAWDATNTDTTITEGFGFLSNLAAALASAFGGQNNALPDQMLQPQPTQSNTALYVVIGVVVLLVITVVAIVVIKK